jgi:hypothetical protein
MLVMYMLIPPVCMLIFACILSLVISYLGNENIGVEHD